MVWEGRGMDVRVEGCYGFEGGVGVRVEGWVWYSR